MIFIVLLIKQLTNSFVRNSSRYQRKLNALKMFNFKVLKETTIFLHLKALEDQTHTQKLGLSETLLGYFRVWQTQRHFQDWG